MGTPGEASSSCCWWQCNLAWPVRVATWRHVSDPYVQRPCPWTQSWTPGAFLPVTRAQVSKPAMHGGTQVVYTREGLLTWHQHTRCPGPFKESGWLEQLTRHMFMVQMCKLQTLTNSTIPLLWKWLHQWVCGVCVIVCVWVCVTV